MLPGAPRGPVGEGSGTSWSSAIATAGRFARQAIPWTGPDMRFTDPDATSTTLTSPPSCVSAAIPAPSSVQPYNIVAPLPAARELVHTCRGAPPDALTTQRPLSLCNGP